MSGKNEGGMMEYIVFLLIGGFVIIIMMILSSKKTYSYGFTTIYLASAGIQKDVVRKALKKLLSITDDRINIIFRTPDIPLLENISKTSALELKEKLEETGALIVLKEVTPVFKGGNILVRLVKTSENKIQVIKHIRDYCGLDLKACKDIIDAAPCNIGYFTAPDANNLVQYLQSAGAIALLEGDTTTRSHIEEATATFQVILQETGDQKIQAIKLIREYTGLNLAEAKNTADQTPSELGSYSNDKAQLIKSRFEEIGAVVKLLKIAN